MSVPPAAPLEPKKTREEEHLLEAFRSHSNLLRNWFVAYGVGAPALLLGKENIWNDLKHHAADTYCVFTMFMIVLGIQGILSAFNKAMDYNLFAATFWPIPKDQQSFFYRCSSRLADCWMKKPLGWWVEFGLDALSIVLLAVATYKAAAILLTLSP